MQKKRTRRKVQSSISPRRKRKSKKVHCQFCHKLVPIEQAHRHAKGWVGPECWDERLRSSS